MNNIICEKNIRDFISNNEAFRFDIFDTVSSTNTLAKEKAEHGAPENTVIIAEKQISGHGRFNRKFESPKDTGIYMSVILRPNLNNGEALMITTAAAVAVSDAVEKLTKKTVGIKWVNDIYMQGKKICGILTETSFNPRKGHPDYAILGIGINTEEPLYGFPDELKDIAGAIYKSGEAPENFRNRLISETLNEFRQIYLKLPNNEYMTAYRKKSIIIGQNVNIFKCGRLCGEGTVEDIDDLCRIKVRYENGNTETLSSGEISIKKQNT